MPGLFGGCTCSQFMTYQGFIPCPVHEPRAKAISEEHRPALTDESKRELDEVLDDVTSDASSRVTNGGRS